MARYSLILILLFTALVGHAQNMRVTSLTSTTAITNNGRYVQPGGDFNVAGQVVWDGVSLVLQSLFVEQGLTVDTGVSTFNDPATFNSNATFNATVTVAGPPLLLLRSTNNVGAIGFTLPTGSWQPTNVLVLKGSNWVVGDILAVESIVGNLVTLTNGAKPTGGSVSTNVMDLAFSGGTNVVVAVTNTVKTYRLFATNNFFVHLSAGAYDEQEITFKTTQDGTGSRVGTYTNSMKFGTTIPDATLSTPPGLTDYIGLQWSAASNHWNTVRFVRGYPQ